jgi:hypothetical protein
MSKAKRAEKKSPHPALSQSGEGDRAGLAVSEEGSRNKMGTESFRVM